MAKDFAKKFYNRKQWLRCRQEIIARDKAICQKCGAHDSNQVDHIEELTEANINDTNITLNPKNLRVLCDACHALKTNSKYSPLNEGYSFDSNGDLIYSPPVKKQNG